MGDVSIQRIPFGNLQASGVEELAGGSPVAMNVVVDPSGTVKRRPGLTLWNPDVIDANGLIALHETTDGDILAVGNGPPGRKIYRVSESGSSDLSPGGQTDVPGTLRPIIAETDALVVFAGGLDPQKLVKASFASSRLGGSPPQGSHVAAIASRLVMNSYAGIRSQVSYSDVAVGSVYAGNEDWTTANAAGVFTAAARPDPVLAVHENTNEVFVFGPASLQVYAPDAGIFFAPVVNRELGCSAPYSVVKTDQNFAWLDHLRRFVVGNGREEQVISEPIQKTLHDMTRVDDCFGYRVVLGYLDAMVWTFPTDGRTFMFQKGASWSEWSLWDGNWTGFPAAAHTRRLETNDVLMGTTDGYIAKLDLDADTDFGDAINAYVVTGFQDRGSDAWKECRRVRFALRRGRTESTSEPAILLSWRDGLGAWEPPIPISMGAAGESNPVVELWSLGVYRRRQWKLDFREAEDLTLVSASEEFQVLAG